MPVIVVTGAGQGIGAAVCRAFAAEPDARLVLTARSRERLEAVAEECRALRAEALVAPADATRDADVERLAAATLEHFGAPDVVVNNAGRFRPGPLAEMTADAFREQIDVNLTSAFLVTRAFLPAMLARGEGTLVYMASVAALRGYPGGAAYCAAKHGMLGLARTVREETRPAGLRVLTLLPGATRTESWDGTDLPDKRFMPAEDVARALVALWRLGPRTMAEEVVLRPQLGDI